ncbi:hypothetical protein B0H14DRAFT_1414020 [Mycena olivaceomarginata]|nr:hypothetical protein B0H14DRAFT_1414020 [Mycena olivaceomarginata]
MPITPITLPTPPHPKQPPPPPPPPGFGAPGSLAQLFTFLARLGTGAAAGADFAAAGLPPNINLGHFIFGGHPAPPPPKDSPAIAARIVEGLERVPEGLVRRLERVSALAGGAASNGGEELGAVGGDSGCAICWDRLLDGDGAEFAPAPAPSSSASSSTPSDPTTSDPASTSTSNTPPDTGITALPCAHVFHSACLLPWFARPGQTTCPTCRFDVDPERCDLVRRAQATKRAVPLWGSGVCVCGRASSPPTALVRIPTTLAMRACARVGKEQEQEQEARPRRSYSGPVTAWPASWAGSSTRRRRRDVRHGRGGVPRGV